MAENEKKINIKKLTQYAMQTCPKEQFYFFVLPVWFHDYIIATEHSIK